MSRTMSLTPELVTRCDRAIDDPGPDPTASYLDDGDYAHLVDASLAGQSPGEPIWLFAYGSLIWKPDFDAVDNRRARAHGWHRSFCLKMTRWRGSPQQNGLMLALARGGSCDGVIYRLPDADRRDQIRRVVKREIRFQHALSMARWIPVSTAEGRERAMVFWAGPSGERVTEKLPLEEVAWILARACGSVGSCAEYLYNTVAHLEEFGNRDRNLWRLQELVAVEIERLHGA
jgi:cation transport protein ChaC